jgi:hypothetical protein
MLSMKEILQGFFAGVVAILILGLACYLKFN